MSTTEHTPCPWIWCHPDASASILHGTEDDPMCTGILIALGHEGCAERQGRNCAITNRPSRNADLALIAAAPDLLAVCKAVIEEWGDYTDFGGGNYERIRKFNDMALAAVAKIEGLS
jgi:hypothetical protein